MPKLFLNTTLQYFNEMKKNYELYYSENDKDRKKYNQAEIDYNKI